MSSREPFYSSVSILPVVYGSYVSVDVKIAIGFDLRPVFNILSKVTTPKNERDRTESHPISFCGTFYSRMPSQNCTSHAETAQEYQLRQKCHRCLQSDTEVRQYSHDYASPILFTRVQKIRIGTGKDRFHHRFSAKEQAKLAGRLITHPREAGGQGVVYEQHMHFIKLNPKPNAVFWYINQIRDPLGHALSNYDFKRYRCFVDESNGACSQVHPSVRNLTMDECVSTGDPARCLTKPYGIGSMISFFCGQESLCDDTKRRPNSSAALALAKYNIEHFYLFVGLLEYMDSSLKLLEHVYPSFFAGIADVHRRQLKLAPVHVTPRKHRHRISNETRAILLQLLKPEYELYEFVRQRFVNQYKKIYGRTP